MTEVLENYREAHESIARHKVEIDKKELSKILVDPGTSLNDRKIEIGKPFPIGKEVTIEPTEPLEFKFLYAKQNQKLEIHMEIEWIPKPTTGTGDALP